MHHDLIVIGLCRRTLIVVDLLAVGRLSCWRELHAIGRHVVVLAWRRSHWHLVSLSLIVISLLLLLLLLCADIAVLVDERLLLLGVAGSLLHCFLAVRVLAVDCRRVPEI